MHSTSIEMIPANADQGRKQNIVADAKQFTELEKQNLSNNDPGRILIYYPY